jgi:signal transduction histidine kinase
LGLSVLIAMTVLAALGYHSIRRDVENLRVISRDNILWTAMQMEVELLRFQLAVAALEIEPTPVAREAIIERFDILWSRIFMLGAGRVGALIARYDEGHGSIPAFQQYLHELDPVVATLEPGDSAQIRAILRELETFRHDLRLYTLRVVRGNAAASSAVRDRIQRSLQTTLAISLAAVLLSALALALILHDNRRQRQIAALHSKVATEAELASGAKSRFLAMMSHELRNPMNGVLGPLALLGQSDLPARHLRLVEQAQASGRSLVQMLAGLLDYGELQDGRFRLRAEPFRLATLAAGVREDLARAGATEARVTLRPGGPELVQGDVERLRHIFVHLVDYVLDGAAPGALHIDFRHDADGIVGEIRFDGGDAAVDWKLDLMMGLGEIAPQQVSTDALRPLIARGLIAAAKGVLSLVDLAEGRRAIRVAIPAPRLRFERIRVRLETRSAALSAIYQAALRSERIVFVASDEPDPADVVLVDATSVGEESLMSALRARFPDALFVSLGAPPEPEGFDDVVESPSDMGRLRSRILGRLAS